MNGDNRRKAERTGAERANPPLLSRHRSRKIAARKWPKDTGPIASQADRVSWQLRADGARIIIQMAKEMATKSRAKLKVIHWLADPAQETPHESSDTYTLVAGAGARPERQVFLREDLERAPASERTRSRVKTILKTVLAGL